MQANSSNRQSHTRHSPVFKRAGHQRMVLKFYPATQLPRTTQKQYTACERLQSGLLAIGREHHKHTLTATGQTHITINVIMIPVCSFVSCTVLLPENSANVFLSRICTSLFSFMEVKATLKTFLFMLFFIFCIPISLF